MSALATPADPVPEGSAQAAAAVITKSRGEAVRRFPGKAKVGAALLALFVLIAIIGPTIAEDYVLVAQAKGLSTHRVMFTYAARNAILPNLAGFALSLGFVVAGALVMEIVFSYPGIGLTLYNAVTSDDFPLLQGIFLVISFSVLAACLIADIVYFFADPRTRTRSAF